MFKGLSVVASVAFGVVAIVGCSGADPTETSDGPAEVTVESETTAQCVPDYSRKAGGCLPTACTSDAQCGAGKYCDFSYSMWPYTSGTCQVVPFDPWGGGGGGVGYPRGR